MAIQQLDLCLAEVTQAPLRTTKGVMWMLPIQAPDTSQMQHARHQAKLAHTSRPSSACEVCPLEGQCRDAVWQGNFIACEKPLLKEVLSECT